MPNKLYEVSDIRHSYLVWAPDPRAALNLFKRDLSRGFFCYTVDEIVMDDTQVGQAKTIRQIDEAE